MVTIYDVAKAAGVAPSTVSRTFARPGRVNADTAERIRQIAEELGYRANPVGRSLASARTRPNTSASASTSSAAVGSSSTSTSASRRMKARAPDSIQRHDAD